MRSVGRTGAAAGPPGQAARSPADAAHPRATAMECGQRAAPPAHGLVRPAAPPASERSSGGPVFLHDGGARWCPGAFGVLQIELGGARGRRLFLARGGSSDPPLPPRAPDGDRTRPRRARSAAPGGRHCARPGAWIHQGRGSAGDGHGRGRDGPSAPTARLLGRGMHFVAAEGGARATPWARATLHPPHRRGEARSVGRAVSASDGHRRGAPDRHRPGRPPGGRTASAPLRPAATASARSRLSARRSPA